MRALAPKFPRDGTNVPRDSAGAFSIANARKQSSIGVAAFHEWRQRNGSPWASFHRVGRDYLLRFPNLADFCVTGDGLSVTCWPTLEATPTTIAHLYQNQVRPLALSLAGNVVLHASAIEIGRAAVAFSAMSGQGKSTLAASFAADGHALFTDDALQVEWHEGACLAVPGPPTLRLWRDSEEALIPASGARALPVQYTDKVRFVDGAGFKSATERRAIHRVYFLNDSPADEPLIEPVKPAAAMIKLVQQSFLLEVQEAAALGSHFAGLARLATLPIYFQLSYPRRYDALPAVRHAVRAHCAIG